MISTAVLFYPVTIRKSGFQPFFKRIVAGVVITIIYFLIGIIFWEDYKPGLGFGIVIFVFTVLFGEKFLKVLAAILRVSGPI